jgi:exopolysaccharide production protein ExoY
LHRLPALENVIAGDLSFVGPAPVDRDGLEAYGAEKRYYLIARPGLITPWRSREASPAGRCRDYVLNWRLRHDLGTIWWALITGGRR